MWTDRYDQKRNLDLLEALALAQCSRITDDVLRAQLTSLVTERDYRGLVGFTSRYDAGYSAGDLIASRAVLALFEKNASLPLFSDEERLQTALRKFEGSELLCRQTNECLLAWERGGFQFQPRVEAVLHTAMRKISSVLGDLPCWDDLRPRFGPGATTETKKSVASPRTKLGAKLTCSGNFTAIAPDFLAGLPGLGVGGAERVDLVIKSGRLSFVPKNAKTYRAIVVEPPLNGMAQLALGDYIAKRLRLVGVDTRDQTKNQRLAREGSITGLLATLDLSSASDTIARKLVWHLLPWEWANVLDCCRTPSIEHEGKRYDLEKFSSMGNGYTFALESLIFWALAKATAEETSSQGEVTTFGDDIILPRTAVPLFREVMRACGFILNDDKSFWDGPFRESCGCDYYAGIDIRPCYLDDVATPQALFVMHNFYVAQYDDEMAELVLGFIPDPVKLFGPPMMGDGHLHKRDFCPTPHKRSEGFCGFVFDTYSMETRKLRKLLPGDHLLPAYSIYRSDGGDERVTPDTVIQAIPRDRFREVAMRHARQFEVRPYVPSQVRTRCRKTGEKIWVWNTVVPGSAGYERQSIYTLTY